MRLEADGLMGAIVGSESLGITNTLINSAGGCRSRAQILLRDLIPSYEPEDRGCCRSKYFSRQSRLPCTYLNNNDIVFGTGTKISEGADSVSSVNGLRTVVVDTLGASLLCTDYSGLVGQGGQSPLILDGDLSSMGFSEGYDLAVSSILGDTDIDGTDNGAVNLLGYGIADLGWEQGSADLRVLLGSMGLRVGCIPGCRPSGNDVASMGGAALNVMVRPEYSRRTAEMLERRFGTPSLEPMEGAPVGFDATRSFVREIGRSIGVDPAPALDLIDMEASAVHKVLMNYDRLPQGLHAKGVIVKGDSSTVYPLLKWMYGTLGMAPRKVVVNDDAYLSKIRGFLEAAGYGEALEGYEGDAELVFTDGISALEGRIGGGTTGYVAIGIPQGRTMDLLGRCVIGTRGCRYLLDEAFNSITRFRCGQPTEVDFRPEH